MKKLLVLFLLFLSIFLIYKTSYKEGYYYLALGDGIALGKNSFGFAEYSYADYLAEYLNKEGKLKNFNKGFAKSRYYIEELLNDLKHNKFLENGSNMKRELREANLVTLSIGLDDLYFGDINNQTDISEIINNYEQLIFELKKYTKGRILVIGYPQFITDEENTLNEMIQKFNQGVKIISQQANIEYIDVASFFDKSTDYFSKPNVFYPNKLGYYQIYQAIIKNIN